MLRFEEYLRVNKLDNLMHEEENKSPRPYTYEDYYYRYGHQYMYYINATIAEQKNEKIF